MDCHRHLLPIDHYPLLYHFCHFDIGTGLKVLHEDLITRDLHCSIDIEIDDALTVDFDWSVDEEVLRHVVYDRRHLDWDLDYFLDDFLDYLRDLNDLLNDPRDDHNLFDYLLNLDTARDLDDLLDDFFLGSRDFLDAFHVHLLRDDLLLPN
jgi:hypothetical protein